jgi:predicted AAA+ superfamily ATPase
MNQLIESFEKKIAITTTHFVRNLNDEINWNARLIGIKGARGVGKTTLLLQYIKLNLANQLDQVLYVSLDNVWFNNHTLLELARTFEQKGGKYLFLDEVHKYPQWSQEIKNIYDDYPELKIVFTGSSLLEILNARADLSRRAIVYHMQGLSFREFIAIETGEIFQAVESLPYLLSNHTTLAREINEKIKIFKHYEEYLKYGYYPFYQEQKDLYYVRLGEVLNMMLEIELPLLRKVEIAYVNKIKQLLSILAESVPFSPNVSKLSDKIGINRNTLLSYLHFLDEIKLTKNLFKQSGGISALQKPSKFYLENTNLMYVLARENTNKGNLRETFFANQVGYNHSLNYTDYGDFLVDEKYVFEIGGKTKTNRQIKEVNQSYIALDDITIGRDNKIPLWMFGFLY